MHLDSSNRLHRGDDNSPQCPHCGSQAAMPVTASPDFRALRQSRPDCTGIVYQCTACGMPVFAGYRVTNFDVHRIDLEALPDALPRKDDSAARDDSFGLHYIPGGVATFFQNALACYEHELMPAFAVMCRMTTEAMINDRGENEKLKFMAQVDEIAELADLADPEYRALCTILFGSGTGDLLDAAELDRGMAAILLETMKDMLHHAYVRRGRLQKRLRMRRYFADPRDDDKARDNPEDTILSIVRPDLKRPAGSR